MFNTKKIKIENVKILKMFKFRNIHN
jgi:hypothetical protein